MIYHDKNNEIHWIVKDSKKAWMDRVTNDFIRGLVSVFHNATTTTATLEIECIHYHLHLDFSFCPSAFAFIKIIA